ncbi:MAG: hypothetical protein ACMZ66_10615 [Thalassospira sp.]|uniref:hypothetical protein n=1 Tax=Thalassospira sp. TaxID=1912094 RepID=UPI003A8C7A2A
MSKENGIWPAAGHAIYRNLNAAMIKAGWHDCKNAFTYFSFINAYQRPAEYGQSIKAAEQDIRLSQRILEQTISILKPAEIIFVSAKAFKRFSLSIDLKTHCIPHPASIWWNRHSKKYCGTGQQRFVDRLRISKSVM